MRRGSQVILQNGGQIISIKYCIATTPLVWPFQFVSLRNLISAKIVLLIFETKLTEQKYHIEATNNKRGSKVDGDL